LSGPDDDAPLHAPERAALDVAIRLLDRPSGDQSCAANLATAGRVQKRSMNPELEVRLRAYAASTFALRATVDKSARQTSHRRRVACLDEARPKGERSLAVRQGFEF
jgi:hypothetical protein